VTKDAELIVTRFERAVGTALVRRCVIKLADANFVRTIWCTNGRLAESHAKAGSIHSRGGPVSLVHVKVVGVCNQVLVASEKIGCDANVTQVPACSAERVAYHGVRVL
jgi:hypothetical protein